MSGGDRLKKLCLFVKLADKGLHLPTVAEQPVVILYDWDVHQARTGEWYLSGTGQDDRRRASTAVVSFRARTGTAVTASGRVYRLHGHRAGYGAAGPLDRVVHQLGITELKNISERVARMMRAARFGRRKSQRSHVPLPRQRGEEACPSYRAVAPVLCGRGHGNLSPSA